MKYACKKRFYVPLLDEDGAMLEQSYVVEVGDVYTRDDSGYRVAGGPNTVRLLGGDGGWIEITKDRLDECFESADKLL